MFCFFLTNNFYNLSNIAFLGGSIVNHGGQNPLEAARLGNYIINGPNINLLGQRERNVYGELTYKALKADLIKYARKKKLDITDEIIKLLNNKSQKLDF